MTWPESPSPREITRHCRRWQWAIALPAALATLVMLAVETLPSEWFTSQGYPLILALLSASVGIFTSGSAIWIVLGTGSWLSRVGMALVIFHAVGIAMLSSLALMEWIRGNPMYDDWFRAYVALLAAASYGFAAHLAVSVFLVWLMKLIRYRLVYFADSGLYPHPRRHAKTVPLEERAGVIALKGRVRLIDLFGLTTLVAIYLGSIYPLQIVMDDDRMFGASFAFIIAGYLMGINALISLPAFLLPLTIGLIDHRGIIFQLIVNLMVLAAACIAAIICHREFSGDPDMVSFVTSACVALLLFQITLAILLHRPSNRLRFRLMRIK